MTKRLDVTLVERGLAPSRTKAQELIDAGQVEILENGTWAPAGAASRLVATQELRVRADSEILRYVSRGGLKLEGALEHLRLNVNGWRCLDVGLSTGGFSDCLLQRGAAAALGFDVGHGQLHPRLRQNARLRAFEGVHVKDVAAHPEIRDWLKGGVDLCVVDLSFISFVSILPALAAALPSTARVLALVKPQFEVGPEGLDKRGVADSGLFSDVQSRVLLALEKCGFSTGDYFPSRVKGQDGNQEFFVFAHRA